MFFDALTDCLLRRAREVGPIARPQRARLVLPQQTAVALDIGMQDRSQLALYALGARPSGVLSVAHEPRLSCRLRPVVKRRPRRETRTVTHTALILLEHGFSLGLRELRVCKTAGKQTRGRQ